MQFVVHHAPDEPHTCISWAEDIHLLAITLHAVNMFLCLLLAGIRRKHEEGVSRILATHITPEMHQSRNGSANPFTRTPLMPCSSVQ